MSKNVNPFDLRLPEGTKLIDKMVADFQEVESASGVKVSNYYRKHQLAHLAGEILFENILGKLSYSEIGRRETIRQLAKSCLYFGEGEANPRVSFHKRILHMLEAVQDCKSVLKELDLKIDPGLALVPFIYKIENTKSDPNQTKAYLRSIDENYPKLETDFARNFFSDTVFLTKGDLFSRTMEAGKKGQINAGNMGLVLDCYRFVSNNAPLTSEPEDDWLKFLQYCDPLRNRFFSEEKVNKNLTIFHKFGKVYPDSSPSFHPFVEMGIYVRGLESDLGDFSTENLVAILGLDEMLEGR